MVVGVVGGCEGCVGVWAGGVERLGRGMGVSQAMGRSAVAVAGAVGLGVGVGGAVLVGTLCRVDGGSGAAGVGVPRAAWVGGVVDAVRASTVAAEAPIADAAAMASIDVTMMRRAAVIQTRSVVRADDVQSMDECPPRRSVKWRF